MFRRIPYVSVRYYEPNSAIVQSEFKCKLKLHYLLKHFIVFHMRKVSLWTTEYK